MRKSSILAALLSLTGAGLARAETRAVLEPRQAVPASLLSTLKATFPERRAVDQAFLSPIFDPNVVLSQRSSVSVTFLSSGAIYRNTFGYFTYELAGPGVKILERGLVFPDATGRNFGGPLEAGDTVTLRDAAGQVRYFEPGTRLGFFLLANGWDGKAVRGWDERNPQLPAAEAAKNAAVLTTLDAINPEAVHHPELARHVAMVSLPGTSGFLEGRPFLVVGMEDVRRDQKTDDDFNDVMFVVHATADQALGGTHVASLDPSSPDADGDGVPGLSDLYPGDPSRATLRPSQGEVGGAAAATEEVFDGRGGLKDVQATFHRAAEAGPAELVLRKLPSSARGTVRVERYLASGERVVEPATALDALLHGEADGTATFRLPDAFRGGPAGAVESLRVVLTFDSPVAADLPAARARKGYPWAVVGARPAAAKAPAAWLRAWSVRAGE